MQITVISVGKKSEASITDAIETYESRVNRVTKFNWEYIAPSGLDGQQARKEESVRILARCKPDSTLWLLDERGIQITSPELGQKLESSQNSSTQHIIIIIGGAFGVDDSVRSRADFIWSLSKLVFPHQIVRLLLVEQLYRAYEINRGSGYHHD